MHIKVREKTFAAKSLSISVCKKRIAIDVFRFIRTVFWRLLNKIAFADFAHNWFKKVVEHFSLLRVLLKLRVTHCDSVCRICILDDDGVDVDDHVGDGVAGWWLMVDGGR